MNKLLVRFVVLIALTAVCSQPGIGQVSSMGSISGTITDPSGAVIVDAVISIRNNATGEEFNTKTADNGTYAVPALASGTYTITVSYAGFKKGLIQNVKVDVGKASTASVSLEIGGTNEVTVVTGVSGELVQTQSANINTTIVGRQITELPFVSRDALDLTLGLPGTQTAGRPRSSTINGLPKGSLNITIDGVNVQQPDTRSGDGFYTWIRPRIDAVEEVSVSTATPGAESAAEGAVQIKFVTRSGSNDLHGSAYWYHRNPTLNANAWFNNRDLPPDPDTGKAPRDRILLNQPGFRIGGPITIPKLYHGRDRSFFFVNFEAFLLPEQQSRQRIILSPQAQQGIFQYTTASGVSSVDLIKLAADGKQTATMDPITASLFKDIRNSTSQGGVSQSSDPNLQNFSFINRGMTTRYFPTMRLDFKLTNKHHLEDIYNYQKLNQTRQFINNADEAFPGFPNYGGSYYDRFSNVIALRSTLSAALVNEARFGFVGGNAHFRPEVNAQQFTNQGGYAIGSSAASATTGFGRASISNPTAQRVNQTRNTPVKQLGDTLSYVRGNHSFSFGGSFSQYNFYSTSFVDGPVPTVTFGLDASDPASAIFVPAKFPGASNAQITAAKNIYAVLTGRLTSVTSRAFLDETSHQYRYLDRLTERIQQREFGFFATDSWRFRSDLTVSYGLRWEVPLPFTTKNNVYSVTTPAGLYGVSGAGNLFKPGTLTGSITTFNPFNPGDYAYNTHHNNFAPSLGLAWSPRAGGLLQRILGTSGQTVIRAGYSVAFNREGSSVVSTSFTANPGSAYNLARTITAGNLTPGQLFREPAGFAPPPYPPTPTYPITGTTSDSVNTFNPDLKVGNVRSWTFGIQREITKDTVVEVRYVGTRGRDLWRRYDLNAEINTIENQFLNEFKLAQANLQANIAAGRGSTFKYVGAGTNTSPLPIILAYFSGVPAAQAGDATKYTSSNFTNTSYVNPLSPNNATPQTFATTLNNSSTNRVNAALAGLPANFFVVNPDYLGGAWTVDNSGKSYYDALTIEVRHRFSAGLMVQASYTWSKSLTNMFASSNDVESQPISMRNMASKTFGPFDLTHGLKMNWIYELPIGRGKQFMGSAHGFVNHLVGNWEVHGTGRIQSGTPFSFGTVQLVGMSPKELDSMVKIRKGVTAVFYLPDDVILNTRRAFNVTPTGYSALGAPDAGGKYIAPAGSSGCVPGYAGMCGFSNVVLHGPGFMRFDISVVKRFKISERAGMEFRAEFLDAFNNINFKVGSPTSDVINISGFSSATFGQTTNAYQDNSTTNDPGGRLIQFVVRINF